MFLEFTGTLTSDTFLTLDSRNLSGNILYSEFVFKENMLRTVVRVLVKGKLVNNLRYSKQMVKLEYLRVMRIVASRQPGRNIN